MNNRTIVVQRDSDGKFHCKKCSKSSESPTFLNYHKKCFFVDEPAQPTEISQSCNTVVESALPTAPMISQPTANNSDEDFDQETPAPSASVQPATPATLLNTYNLCFDPERRFLYCTTCKCILSFEVARHLRRVHQATISNVAEAIILRSFDILQFQPDFQVPSPVIPYLPLLTGFQCQTCLNCFFTKKNMESHCRKDHGPLGFRPVHVSVDGGNNVVLHSGPLNNALNPALSGFECSTCLKCYVEEKLVEKHCGEEHGIWKYLPVSVQTNDIGSAKKYFPVFVVEPMPILVDSVDVDAVLARNTGVLDCSIRAPEDVRTRNIFYNIMSWFTAESELEALKTVDLPSYFKCPLRYPNLAEKLKTFFMDSLKAVGEWGFLYRLDLGNQSVKEPFRVLSEDAMKEYSAFYCKFVFFLINYANKPLTQYMSYSAELNGKVLDFCNGFSDDALFRLLSFVTQERITSAKETDSIIPLAMRLLCVRGDGSLESPENIGRNGAKLIYLTKMVLFESARLSNDLYQYILDHLEVIDVSRHYVCSFLILVTGQAKDISMNTKSLARLYELESGKTLIVDGQRLELESIKSCYRGCLGQVRQRLTALELGLKVNLNLDELADDLSNECINYSFGHMDPAKNAEMKRAIFRHVLNTPELKQRFIADITSNEVTWNRGAIQRYLELHDEYMNHLLALIHVGSGAPARGTELSTYRICNGNSNIRTVYLFGDRIFFFVTYSKTNALSGKTRDIVRFLDVEASRLLIEDLLFVRPFVAVLAEALERNESNVYLSHLFVRWGTPMTGTVIRTLFSQYFAELTGFHLTFQCYRHIAKFIANGLRLGMYTENFDVNEEAEDDYLLRQFSHSAAVANTRYAVTYGEHGCLKNHELAGYRRTSDIWHAYLRGTCDITQVAPVAFPSLPTQVVSTQASVCTTQPSVLATISSVSASFLEERKVSKDGPAFYASKSQSMESLELLKKLVGIRGTRFRSVEQQIAVDVVLHSNLNVFCVLPTGCGKSMLFFLNCLKNLNGVTVVVVPLIALREDLLRRAADFKILACGSIQEYAGHSLLVLTMDAAVTPEALYKLQGMRISGKLSRVFIDEAHCYMTDVVYRDVMLDLPKLRLLEVPTALLTATAPLWIEEQLLADFFPVSKPYVIRSSTNRPNICYEIRADLGMASIVREIKAAVEQLESHERAIVYFATVNNLELYSSKFESGFETYHSKMSDEAKMYAAMNWQEGVIKLMLATSAFGLGIDFPSVRKVFIVGLPYSMEDYVQQCGRAGRDGEPSSAVVYYNSGFERQRRTLMNGVKLAKLEKVVEYATDQVTCRRQLISGYMDRQVVACFYDGGLECDNCAGNRGASGASMSTGVKRRMETASDNVVDARVIQRGYNSKEVIRKKAERMIARYVSACPLCLAVDNTVEEHPFEQCCKVRGKCLRCLGMMEPRGHGASECPLQYPWLDGYCRSCCLPYVQEDAEWHKRCGNAHVREYCVALYRMNRNAFDIEFSRYWEWLHEEEDGMLNCVRVMMQCRDNDE